MCNKTAKCTFVTANLVENDKTAILNLVENDKMGVKNLVGILRRRIFTDKRMGIWVKKTCTSRGRFTIRC